MQGLALPGCLQLKGSLFCQENADEGGVLEDGDGAGRVFGYRTNAGCVFGYGTNTGIPRDRGSPVAGDRKEAENQQAGQRDPDARANRQMHLRRVTNRSGGLSAA